MKGKPASPNVGHPARELLEEWKRRGLPEAVPDIKWAHQWIEIGRTYVETREYRMPPHPPALALHDVALIERVIKDRRSIIIW